MDKVKYILQIIAKQLFWMISAATIVLVLIFWWWSTRSLANQFQERKKVIDGLFSGVQAIIDNQEHPNDQLIEAVNNKDEDLKKGVLQVWQVLYDAQKEKNPWPAVLGKDFIEKINSLGPDDSIPVELRERYQNVIKDYFPALFKIISLRETVDEGGRGGEEAAPRSFSGRPSRRGGMPMPDFFGNAEMGRPSAVGVVDWEPKNLNDLRQRFVWTQTPDSFQVRLAQEDLWVYETLLRVISETNGSATQQSQAAIKRIETLEIGAAAVKAWDDADQKVFRSGAVQDPRAEPGRGSTESRGSTFRYESSAPQTKEELLKDRYVDDKGAPLAADAPHPYAEFKMMPISMKLQMDQRDITKLLVECANRAMPIEVRRVRLWPGEGEVFDPGSASTGPTSAAHSPAYRPTLESRLRRGEAAPSLGSGPAPGELGPYDIPVEIQGVIYIYNPPDKTTLGTGAAGEKPSAPAGENAAATGAENPPPDTR